MPLRVAEAFILQTRPLREADKIVSFYTREHGRRRGIAFGARRSKTRFGARLEPLSRVIMRYFEHEGRDLDRLDNCELICSLVTSGGGSHADPGAELQRNLVIAGMVEVAERLLPEHEANDTVFRLMGVTTDYLRQAATDTPAAGWLTLSYFWLWMSRLAGVLPDLSVCTGCRQPLALEATFWWEDGAPGLFCAQCQGARRQALPAGAGMLAAAMLRMRVEELGENPEALATAAGHAGCQLRRYLRAGLEAHLEARLQSWPMLAEMEAVAER